MQPRVPPLSIPAPSPIHCLSLPTTLLPWPLDKNQHHFPYPLFHHSPFPSAAYSLSACFCLPPVLPAVSQPIPLHKDLLFSYVPCSLSLWLYHSLSLSLSTKFKPALASPLWEKLAWTPALPFTSKLTGPAIYCCLHVLFSDAVLHPPTWLCSLSPGLSSEYLRVCSCRNATENFQF